MLCTLHPVLHLEGPFGCVFLLVFFMTRGPYEQEGGLVGEDSRTNSSINGKLSDYLNSIPPGSISGKHDIHVSNKCMGV